MIFMCSWNPEALRAARVGEQHQRARTLAYLYGTGTKLCLTACGEDTGVPNLVTYLKRQLTDYHVEHVIKSRTLHVFVPQLGVAVPESREQSNRNEGCGQ
jgi:hypothetical protein